MNTITCTFQTNPADTEVEVHPKYTAINIRDGNSRGSILFADKAAALAWIESVHAQLNEQVQP